MSKIRRDKHKNIVFWSGVQKEFTRNPPFFQSRKPEYQERWRQVKKAEDERMLRKYK